MRKTKTLGDLILLDEKELKHSLANLTGRLKGYKCDLCNKYCFEDEVFEDEEYGYLCEDCLDRLTVEREEERAR